MVRMKGYATRTATFDTEQEAIDWRETVIKKQKSGKALTKQDESERVTLKDALERYRREVTPSKAGHKEENNRIKALQKLPLAEWYLAEIGAMQIAELRDYYQSNGLAPSTIKNNIRPISNTFETARTEWGMYVLGNPVRGVRMPRDNEHRDRRVSESEEAQLLDELNTPYCEAFLFMIETGLRRSELCRLIRTEINFKTRTMRIRKTKTRKQRIVPLSSKAVSILKTLPSHTSGSVFGIANPDTFTHNFTAACKKLEIEDLVIHDARHEAVSRWVESGKFRDSEIMSMSGHTTLKSFMVYVQIKAEDLARRMD